jgi:hypothetical protein
METPENKRLLKEIMEKWSRPIFAKSMDERGFTANHSTDPEIRQALLAKYAAASSSSEFPDQADAKSAATGTSSRSVNMNMASVMSGAVGEEGTNQTFSRVKTPFSNGFLFTVQPQLKVLDKGNRMERTLGESRMKLFDKMVRGGSGGADNMGRKQNPR